MKPSSKHEVKRNEKQSGKNETYLPEMKNDEVCRHECGEVDTNLEDLHGLRIAFW